MAAKILEWRCIEDQCRVNAQAPHQDLGCIRARHRVHGVEGNAEAAGDERADCVEIEQGLHQFGVVGDGINDFDRHAARFETSDPVEINIVEIGDLVVIDHLGPGIDRLGDLFRRGTAV